MLFYMVFYIYIYIYIERVICPYAFFPWPATSFRRISTCEDLTTLCNTLRKAAPHGVITVPNLLGALGWMVGIDGWGLFLMMMMMMMMMMMFRLVGNMVWFS